MPTKAVSAETMEVGKKGGGKHWTAAEIAARQEAAETLKRKEAKKLKPPDWLGAEGREIWARKLRETQGVELLDVLDGECLAMYCDALAKHAKISKKHKLGVEDHKAMQAYMRIVASLADKLGFTPAARARLIKKRAEKQSDPFGEAFDD